MAFWNNESTAILEVESSPETDLGTIITLDPEVREGTEILNRVQKELEEENRKKEEIKTQEIEVKDEKTREYLEETSAKVNAQLNHNVGIGAVRYFARTKENHTYTLLHFPKYNLETSPQWFVELNGRVMPILMLLPENYWKLDKKEYENSFLRNRNSKTLFTRKINSSLNWRNITSPQDFFGRVIIYASESFEIPNKFITYEEFKGKLTGGIKLFPTLAIDYLIKDNSQWNSNQKEPKNLK